MYYFTQRNLSACFVPQEHVIKTILTSARDEPSAPARYVLLNCVSKPAGHLTDLTSADSVQCSVIIDSSVHN